MPGVDAGILETAALVASVAGTAVSAYGAYQQGQAQSKMNQYQAEVAQQQAKMATQQGEEKSLQVGLANRQRMGGIIASEAASGVDVNSGSSADVQKSARVLGQSDVNNTLYNASIKNYGFRTQSSLDEFASKQAETAGDIGAVGSLLGGASSAGSQYANFLTKS